MHLLSAPPHASAAGVGLAAYVVPGLALAAVFLWYFKGPIHALWAGLTHRATCTNGALYRTVSLGAVAVVLIFLLQWIIEGKDPVVVYMRF
jgi:hypothetical protein